MRVTSLLVASLALLPCVARAQGTVDPDTAPREAFEAALAVDRFESFQLDAGVYTTVDAYITAIVAEIDRGADRASAAVERLGTVCSYGRARWSIAAWVEQGRIYETLVEGVLRRPPLGPTFLLAPGREVTARIERSIESRTEPLVCYAISRYVLATRVARDEHLATDASRAAVRRLRAFSEGRIAACMDQQGEQYRPGELNQELFGPHDSVRRNRVAGP